MKTALIIRHTPYSNGRLQFVYPVGMYSDKDDEDKMIERMQKNIDYQQSLFQRK